MSALMLLGSACAYIKQCNSELRKWEFCYSIDKKTQLGRPKHNSTDKKINQFVKGGSMNHSFSEIAANLKASQMYS